MTSVPTLHDYEIHGYRVDSEARSITFTMYPPKGQPQAPSQLVFSQVEGYLVQHDLGRNIILSVEEQALDHFLADHEATFADESKWGWPLFWKGSRERTAQFVSSKGCRVWGISSSYGLSGWVVAREAQWSNGK